MATTPSPLDVEFPELRLRLRLGVAIDDGEEIQRVDPQADDVEWQGSGMLRRHDLTAPAVIPATT